MLKKLLRGYLRTSLILRIVIGFGTGSIIGGLLWAYSGVIGQPATETVVQFIAPLGSLLINMLKMIVIPVIFFSIVTGAASLTLRKFGGIGLKVILWYLATSTLAAVVGASLALAINPGSGSNLAGWERLIGALGMDQSIPGASPTLTHSLASLVLSMFQNPFEALATNNFLAIIVFSLLFGLGIRVLLESGKSSVEHRGLESIISLLNAARAVIFKLVDWILEYSPIGVFALALTNFGLYGKNIVGPYVSVTLGVIGGIVIMMFGVYPLMIALITHQNPVRVMRKMDEAIITAFITRSSAATLPVSLHTMQSRLKVKPELTSFTLPLGATINMDGVCVHLPMFAILAANMFGIDLTLTNLIILVITTVLASIGAGGVPGGSLMLLFIILESLGLNGAQIAIMVALATGINPILDMFETANNVTGDMICTYIVAHKEKMFNPDFQGSQ
ncbi:MAG: dicarboxylate/amino acid:cation symporter [Candidatus Neomarinimicrobiota bacterium]